MFNQEAAEWVTATIAKSDNPELLALMVVADVLHEDIAKNQRAISGLVTTINKRMVTYLDEIGASDDAYALIAKANSWQMSGDLGRSPDGKFKSGAGDMTAGVDTIAALGASGSTARSVAQGVKGFDQGYPQFAREWDKAAQNPAATNAKTYGRVQAGSQLLGQIGVASNNEKLQVAGAVGNLAGQYGKEAEKVFGSSIRRAMYRYQGSEKKKPDPALQQAHAQALAAGADPRTSARDVAVQFMQTKVPAARLAELHRKSGKITPSEGVGITADGEIINQSFGAGEDHFLPFNLKGLGKLRGGEYVRTRTSGGLTGEDVNAALASGVKRVTVVSNSGVFTVDFDGDLTANKRLGNEARKMTTVYEHTLDAIKNGNIDKEKIDSVSRGQLLQQAEREKPSAVYGAKETQKKYNELSEEFRTSTQLMQFELDALKADASQKFPDGGEEHSQYLADQMEEAQNRKERRVLQLDGDGYATALDALQEQFPYFIKNVSYTARSETKGGDHKYSAGQERRNEREKKRKAVNQAYADGGKDQYGRDIGGEGRAWGKEKDSGYVMPKHVSSEATQQGFYDPRIAGVGNGESPKDGNKPNDTYGGVTPGHTGKTPGAFANYANWSNNPLNPNTPKQKQESSEQADEDKNASGPLTDVERKMKALEDDAAFAKETEEELASLGVTQASLSARLQEVNTKLAEGGKPPYAAPASIKAVTGEHGDIALQTYLSDSAKAKQLADDLDAFGAKEAAKALKSRLANREAQRRFETAGTGDAGKAHGAQLAIQSAGPWEKFGVDVTTPEGAAIAQRLLTKMSLGQSPARAAMGENEQVRQAAFAMDEDAETVAALTTEDAKAAVKYLAARKAGGADPKAPTPTAGTGNGEASNQPHPGPSNPATVTPRASSGTASGSPSPSAPSLSSTPTGPATPPSTSEPEFKPRGAFARLDTAPPAKVQRPVEASIKQVNQLEDYPVHELARLLRQQKPQQEVKRDEDAKKILSDFDSNVGMTQVKREVHRLYNWARQQQTNAELGMPADQISLSMQFTGGAGTGKTETAKALGKLWHSLGVLPTDNFTRVTASELTGAVVGETEKKVTEALNEAKGGVLLVDEAYGFADSQYGSAAVRTLLDIEESRGDTMVILAGYPEDMKKLEGMNQGLKSRFNTTIAFPDYNENELLQIGEKMAAKSGHKLTDRAKAALHAKIAENSKDKTFAQARGVRNILDDAKKNQAVRLQSLGREQTLTDAQRITDADILGQREPVARPKARVVQRRQDGQVYNKVRAQMRAEGLNPTHDEIRQRAFG